MVNAGQSSSLLHVTRLVLSRLGSLFRRVRAAGIAAENGAHDATYVLYPTASRTVSRIFRLQLRTRGLEEEEGTALG